MYKRQDDKVYAVLFESVLNRAKIVALRERGESGSTSEALPEDWDSAQVLSLIHISSKQYLASVVNDN